jgi:DNA-binding NarL/FixJ family response regulator
MGERPVRVLVVDDQRLVREGVASLLALEPGIEVVGTAADGRGAVEHAVTHRPDVVLMDVRMPGTDGVEATATVRRRAPDVRVVMLTTFDDEDYDVRALRAGASGYLLKHAAPQDLIFAVRKVAGGDTYVDPSVAGRLVAALAATDPARHDLPELVRRLTPREREVLVLMAEGLSNPEIRGRLQISEATVKTHVARVLMKTGSRDRTAAVVLAYRSGLVQP